MDNCINYDNLERNNFFIYTKIEGKFLVIKFYFIYFEKYFVHFLVIIIKIKLVKIK